MVSRRAASVGTALVLSLALVSACANNESSDDDSGGGGGGDSTLTVYAAASLTKTFEQIGAEFEKEHDGVKVEFSFGGSSDLVSQIQEGAPADVFASADEANMEKLTGEDLQADDPQNFASNTLGIVTPPDNPAGIATLGDLDGSTWVRCADDVPCGRIALAVLEDAGVDAEPVSLEEDVRATLDKVISGEADAGLVYGSDAVAAGGDVTAIPIEGAEAQLTSYFIDALAQSEDSDLAEDWVDLVTGPDGQAALTEAGFTLP